jgi:hypothetical protein
VTRIIERLLCKSSVRTPYRNKTTNFTQQHSDRKKCLVASPRVGSTPRHTDWLTVSSKVTSTSTSTMGFLKFPNLLRYCTVYTKQTYKQTLWSESASELYRPSDRRLSAKLVLTLADRRCHVVSVTDPYGRILDFLHRSRYFFFQAAPQLQSRG